MDADLGQFVVIEAGAPHGSRIEPEPEGLHEVQAGARIRAQPDDVTGIGRDLRFEQDDVQWHRIGCDARGTAPRRD